MKETTTQRKKAIRGMQEAWGQEWIIDQMSQVFASGKQGFDIMLKEIGRMVAEAIMYIDREEVAGPDYHPVSPEVRKWASQGGAVYIGDQKIKAARPRLRGPKGEIALQSYQKLKAPDGFSEDLLTKILRGLSCQKYAETVVETAQAFGGSASAISQHLVAATAQQLREFKERMLSEFVPCAIFLDTIHRGGEAFIIALGLDTAGAKMALGFWQGATENHELCEELLAELERRGLTLSRKVIWVTDGGKGIIKTLKARFGKKLLHQRCTIHKPKSGSWTLPPLKHSLDGCGHEDLSLLPHPQGETSKPSFRGSGPPIPVETYGGRIHVEWDPHAAVTPLGQLPFFIEFLKTADLFAPWVQDCPLQYQSPNAPRTVDLLGTLLLSILSGIIGMRISRPFATMG